MCLKERESVCEAGETGRSETAMVMRILGNWAEGLESSGFWTNLGKPAISSWCQGNMS